MIQKMMPVPPCICFLQIHAAVELYSACHLLMTSPPVVSVSPPPPSHPHPLRPTPDPHTHQPQPTPDPYACRPHNTSSDPYACGPHNTRPALTIQLPGCDGLSPLSVAAAQRRLEGRGQHCSFVEFLPVLTLLQCSAAKRGTLLC